MPTIFETNAFDLRHLDEEHADIRRHYEGLDEVILRQGSMHTISRILGAADNLAYLMLLHFTHEEQLLVKLSRYSFLQRPRQANTKIATQLSHIKAGLEHGKVAPVFQLLRLTNVWMKEHKHMGSVDCTGLIEEENSFWARPAVAEPIRQQA